MKQIILPIRPAYLNRGFSSIDTPMAPVDTVVLVVTTTLTVAPTISLDTTTTQYVYRTVVASQSGTSASAQTAIALTTTSTSTSKYISAASGTKSASFSATSPVSKSMAAMLMASVSSTPILPVNVSTFSESTTSSSKLGMAIGIPMAVLSLCIVAAVAWSFYHKKAAQSGSFKTSNRKEPELVATIPHSWSNTPQLQIPERKSGLLNRLSRKINFSEWPGSPREFKSPLFLRRFHLLNEKDRATEPEKVLPTLPNLSLNKVDPLDVVDKKDPQMSLVGKKFIAVKPYARRLGDELSLCAGEEVTVEKVHGDGWVSVKVGTSLGLVPMICLKKF